jgi:hypothetical protein
MADYRHGWVHDECDGDGHWRYHCWVILVACICINEQCQGK